MQKISIKIKEFIGNAYKNKNEVKREIHDKNIFENLLPIDNVDADNKYSEALDYVF